jgi:hypothetical protein
VKYFVREFYRCALCERSSEVIFATVLVKYFVSE